MEEQNNHCFGWSCKRLNLTLIEQGQQGIMETKPNKVHTFFNCRSIEVQKECFFDKPKRNIIDLKCSYQIHEKQETIFSLNSHKSLASLGSVANSIGLSSLQSDKYLPLTPSKSG